MHIRTFASFDDLSDGYLSLFDRQSNTAFDGTLAWFRTFASEVLAGDGRPMLLGVEPVEGEMPLALFPLQVLPRSASPFEPRTVSAMGNYYTSLYAPVIDRGADLDKVVRPAVRRLAADRPRWGIVDLKPLDADSPAYPLLRRALRDAGFFVQPYFCFGNWYLDVAGRSFDEYLHDLPSVTRNTVRRKSRKLDRSGRARIEIVEREDDLGRAMAAYRTVYSSSWKVPEPYPAFIERWARVCARRGWLRLGLIHVDGEPAAAQLWIVHRDTASIYKLAYDERFSDLSVGTVLTARLMAHVLDRDRVSVVDYLTGDDAYKSAWMSHRRERWGLMAFHGRSARGLLSAARHIGGRALKNAAARLTHRRRGKA